MKRKKTAAMRIHYAQCWEDPRALEAGLAVGPGDDVVTIASGGDNTFALLLQGPRSLAAVDRNAAQIHLVELKMRAIQNLGYEEFAGFVGARPSRDRSKLYEAIRGTLSGSARTYWDANQRSVVRGIIHCGKFEDYFRTFRRSVLPLIHGRKTVRRLLSATSAADQLEFYNTTWNSGRWRMLFRVFFGKLLLGRLGRDPSYFRYVTLDKVAETLADRTRHALTEIPIRDNYFIEYILTGTYGRLESGPPWLRPSSFEPLKKNVGRLRLVHAGLHEYLRTLRAGAVSKFYLSDIFEYMAAAEVEACLGEIGRVSGPGAKLAFWTLFIPRAVPLALAGRMTPTQELAERLLSEARAFFYGGFCLWSIQPADIRLETVPSAGVS
jgi:S-adenosylmethionine-diacylglycerol 3-amino-3-carboxypropyl transferase